jgi:hypothetical protein
MDALMFMDMNTFMLATSFAIIGFGIWLVVKGYKVTGVMAAIVGFMFLRLSWWSMNAGTVSGGRRRR